MTTTTPSHDDLLMLDQFAATLAGLDAAHLDAGGRALRDYAQTTAFRMAGDLEKCGVSVMAIPAYGAPGVPAARVQYERARALTVVALPIAYALLEAMGWRVQITPADELPDTLVLGWRIHATEAPAGVDVKAWPEAARELLEQMTADDGDDDECGWAA